ncbi:unknown [Neodiprion lecontei nucleopolyhedrovirus]|uniref:Uncharacterized protein n=1 Tax=Neodiprion lecontei nucleopolyhedrovirus (strain Canada) TaxID=654906 RepID=Q6JPG7_NPVNC|nr:unknown [Neodiprion lecontei nucleopolyhedrovirus]AAQ99049.1 unknown [Neodiprion lecontei nucleopolyhedrovirus]
MSASTRQFGKRKYSKISDVPILQLRYDNTDTLMSRAALERLDNLLNIAKHETATINNLTTLFKSYPINQISNYFTIFTSHVRAKRLSECKKQRLDFFHEEIFNSIDRETTIYEMSEFLIQTSNEIQLLTQKNFVDNQCTYAFGTQLKELFDWVLATDEFLDKIYIKNKFLTQLNSIVDTRINTLLFQNESNDNSESLQNVFVRHYDNTPVDNFVDQLLSMFHEASRDNIISVYQTLPHESRIVAKKHIAKDVYDYLNILKHELSQKHVDAKLLFKYTTKLIGSLEITTIYLDQKINDDIINFLKSMIKSDKICNDERLKDLLLKATCSANKQ